jgi:hypothetical protein
MDTRTLRSRCCVMLRRFAILPTCCTTDFSVIDSCRAISWLESPSDTSRSVATWFGVRRPKSLDTSGVGLWTVCGERDSSIALRMIPIVVTDFLTKTRDPSGGSCPFLATSRGWEELARKTMPIAGLCFRRDRATPRPVWLPLRSKSMRAAVGDTRRWLSSAWAAVSHGATTLTPAWASAPHRAIRVKASSSKTSRVVSIL